LKSRTIRLPVGDCIKAFLLGAALLVSNAGCHLWPMRKPAQHNAPIAFQTTPTLEEITAHVNNNSNKVQQLRAESARISVSGFPTLQANLALERPKRFRLQGQLTQLTGSEMDIGSNDELFWLWVKRQPPPTIYFARRDQFARSPARAMLPIEPDWLINALGMVTFDPADQHEGPYQRGENQWEIRTRLSGDHQGMTKSTLVDGSYGWVTAQHVYDAKGQLIASARASDHRQYVEGIALPATVDVSLPPANFKFQLTVPRYVINQPVGDPQRLWSMPREPGVAVVDIAAQQPAALMGPAGAPPASTPAYNPSPASAPSNNPAYNSQPNYSPPGNPQPNAPPGYAPPATDQPIPGNYGPTNASPDAYSPGYDASAQAPSQYSPSQYAPESANDYPRTGYRPSYRGVTSQR